MYFVSDPRQHKGLGISIAERSEILGSIVPDDVIEVFGGQGRPTSVNLTVADAINIFTEPDREPTMSTETTFNRRVRQLQKYKAVDPCSFTLGLILGFQFIMSAQMSPSLTQYSSPI